MKTDKKAKKPYIISKKSPVSLAAASFSQETKKLPGLRNEVHPLNPLEAEIDRILAEKIAQAKAEIFSHLPQLQQLFEPKLPVSIFCNVLSTLRAVVKFLHENQQRTFAEIAAILQRDQRTIWHTYQQTLQLNVQLKVEKSGIAIPVSIFARRQLAPLEALVSHLHEQEKLSLAEIARLLLLSPKTAWTVYRRYKKKNAS